MPKTTDLPVDIAEVFELAKGHAHAAAELDQQATRTAVRIAVAEGQLKTLRAELAKFGREKTAEDNARDAHMRMLTAECNHRGITVPTLPKPADPTADLERLPYDPFGEQPIEHLARTATTDTAMLPVVDGTSSVPGAPQPGAEELNEQDAEVTA